MDNCIENNCRLERASKIYDITSLLNMIFKKDTLSLNPVDNIFFCVHHVVFHYCNGDECFLDENGTCEFTGNDHSHVSENNFQYSNEELFSPISKGCFNINTLDHSFFLSGETPEAFTESILRNIDHARGDFFNRENDQFMKILNKMYTGFIKFCLFNLTKNKSWAKKPMNKIARTKHEWIASIVGVISQTREEITPNTRYMKEKHIYKKNNRQKNKIIVKNFIHLLCEMIPNGKIEWWRRKACLSKFSIVGSGIRK